MKAVEVVAGILGNTRAVCRKSYIHPALVDAYMDGTMIATLSKRTPAAGRRKLGRLRPDEHAVVVILQHRLTRDAKKRKAA